MCKAPGQTMTVQKMSKGEKFYLLSYDVASLLYQWNITVKHTYSQTLSRNRADGSVALSSAQHVRQRLCRQKTSIFRPTFDHRLPGSPSQSEDRPTFMWLKREYELFLHRQVRQKVLQWIMPETDLLDGVERKVIVYHLLTQPNS